MIYDLIVIGGGPAGYLASERAAHAGLSVLCIEKSSVGGVCLNEGCIPTKTLLYSAKLFDGARHGGKYGVTAGELTIDHKKVLARKNKVVRLLVSGVANTLKAKGVQLVNAQAVITGKTAEGFAVEAGGEAYVGKRLLLATGSAPAVPPIPGLRETIQTGRVLTNREILELEEIPAKLVVIGGGVIGLEMASYFCSVGSEVTVIEMLDHIAGENDRELTGLLQKNYEKKGMRFLLGAKVSGVTEEGVAYEKDGEAAVAPADKVLLSIGRKANTAGLGLEALGVALERGAIATDDHLRTNIPGVYAAGDVNGKSMLAHTAYREAEVAVNDMLGIEDAMRYHAVPGVLYTNPELAGVGYTEAGAQAAGLKVQTIKLPLRFSGRYLAENEGGDGVCKLIVDQKDNVVVGAQALSNYASEFIVTAGVFIEMRMTLDQIKKIIFPHPTVCEILREAVWAAEEQ
ncbi:MAG: dihydrolipoyl dehydrogenase [Christensenellaceae bacterium]|jgi:dihydrolipoamide dehydrogenase|nr:dihydrolipoyl dehydrogenase [Christensenellaceae bacterium]